MCFFDSPDFKQNMVGSSKPLFFILQGGSKVTDLQTMISKMMKTTNQHEQRIRYISSREEAINRCLTSLIHALNCREGVACTAAGCQKMKRVVEHTRTCQRKTSNIRGCPICTQLMSLCFYHSKLCRQSVCLVPFCKLMKRKLQTVNESLVQQENMQRWDSPKNWTLNITDRLRFSLKPVPQFVIPPTAPMKMSAVLSNPSTRERISEPSPKRLRLDEDSSPLSQHSILINTTINSLGNAQAPPNTEVM